MANEHPTPPRRLIEGVLPADDPRLMEPVTKMLRDGAMVETVVRITGVPRDLVEKQKAFLKL